MRKAVVVAARRTALGRVGGLHRSRRIEALAGPVIEAALADAEIAPGRVDRLVMGASLEGANPARLVALAAGLGERTPALTVDSQCASALEAVIAGGRLIASGEADIVVAGGAESLSTAPWRIARPLNGSGHPRFLPLAPEPVTHETIAAYIEAAEAFAHRQGITRRDLDDSVLRSHARAELAGARRLRSEIVALRPSNEEAQDQRRADEDGDDLAEHSPFQVPNGVLTPANISAPADGAGFVVLVGEDVLARSLSSQPALTLAAHATAAVPTADMPLAMLRALEAVKAKVTPAQWAALGVVEIAETTAVEALALARGLSIHETIIGPEGSAVTRGRAGAASGGILMARLFTHLVRATSGRQVRVGAAAVGTTDGMATAVLLERRE